MGSFTKEKYDLDVEQTGGEKPAFSKDNSSSDYVADEGAVPAETFVIGDTWVAKLQRLAGKMGVEQRGIERVPADERDSTGMSSIGTLVKNILPYEFATLLIISKVALSEHGRQLLCHWSFGVSYLPAWIC